MYAQYPRYCAICGEMMQVTPQSPYGGEVCDIVCFRRLEMRKVRSILGKPYDREEDGKTRQKALDEKTAQVLGTPAAP